jgi:hypothetical protein
MFVARPEMNVLFIKKVCVGFMCRSICIRPRVLYSIFYRNIKSLLLHISFTLIGIFIHYSNMIVDICARPLCIDVFGSSIDVTSIVVIYICGRL